MIGGVIHTGVRVTVQGVVWWHGKRNTILPALLLIGAHAACRLLITPKNKDVIISLGATPCITLYPSKGVRKEKINTHAGLEYKDIGVF